MIALEQKSRNKISWDEGQDCQIPGTRLRIDARWFTPTLQIEVRFTRKRLAAAIGVRLLCDYFSSMAPRFQHCKYELTSVLAQARPSEAANILLRSRSRPLAPELTCAWLEPG
jgi:hypothetical protein